MRTLPVRIFGSIAFEQLDSSAFLDLSESLVNHAAHITFVILVWPENVKVLETRNARKYPAALGVAIEDVF